MSVLGLKVEDDPQPNLAQLPPGARLALISEPAESGLVRVRDVSGITYTVFYTDLLDRAESVNGNAT
jgi:hypothetical protein